MSDMSSEKEEPMDNPLEPERKRLHIEMFQPEDIDRRQFYDADSVEVNILKTIHHKNVVRFFCVDAHDGEKNMLVEKTKYNLEYYATHRRDFRTVTITDIMTQLLDGLSYLHSKAITHCNLNPMDIHLNEEIELTSGEVNIVVKIAGFAFARSDTSRDQITTKLKRNDRFSAPEVRNASPENLSAINWQRADIYSAGTVYRYLLTDGQLTIGESRNILVEDLNKWMINEDPEKRPRAIEAMRHPALMTGQQKLALMCEFYEALSEDDKNEIERKKKDIGIEENWKNQFDAKDNALSLRMLAKDIFMPKKEKKANKQERPGYNPKMAIDVFRMIRNERTHFCKNDSASINVKGATPDDFGSLIFKLFPGTVLYAYKTTREKIKAGNNGLWASLAHYVQ